MISYIGKKVLLLICFMSGFVIGSERSEEFALRRIEVEHHAKMDLHKDNCIVRPINMPVPSLNKNAHTVLFYFKNEPGKIIVRDIKFFDQPINSTSWHIEKRGILHVNLADGSTYEMDVNNPLN